MKQTKIVLVRQICVEVARCASFVWFYTEREDLCWERLFGAGAHTSRAN